MSLQNSQQISDVKILLKKGMDGNGIVSIEKTGTQDNIDTYTITYEDGGKDTFTVTNGRSINSIVKTGTSGLVDTYTITFNDTQTATFTVTNGRSINSITKTGSSAGVDTYTIAYNDNTTSTFTVTNGTVATGVSYNNSTSHMTADDVQEAIDELNSAKVAKAGDTVTGDLTVEGTFTATTFFNLYSDTWDKQVTLTLPTTLTDNRTIAFPNNGGTLALTSQIARSEDTLTDYSNVRIERFGKVRTVYFNQSGMKQSSQSHNVINENGDVVYIPSADRPKNTVKGYGFYTGSSGSTAGVGTFPVEITISSYGNISMTYIKNNQTNYVDETNATINGMVTYIVE